MGRGMAWLASLALLGVLYLFFDSSLQARNNPNRELQIAPGAELMLQRSRDGHYVFPGEINGRPVSFLLDTGATLVSVPAHLAAGLGLVAGAPQQSVTANGTVLTRATQIGVLAFGPFKLSEVRASLNPGMRGRSDFAGHECFKATGVHPAWRYAGVAPDGE